MGTNSTPLFPPNKIKLFAIIFRGLGGMVVVVVSFLSQHPYISRVPLLNKKLSFAFVFFLFHLLVVSETVKYCRSPCTVRARYSVPMAGKKQNMFSLFS